MAPEEARNVRNKFITITLAEIFMIKNSDLFCYVCGSFTIGAQRRSITPDLKKYIYKLYFGCPVEDDNKQRAPHQICTFCSSGLQNRLNKRTSVVPLAISMIWREPKNHF